MEKVIWSNEYDTIEALSKDILEDPDGFYGVDENNVWAVACEQNDEFLEDEMANLNIDVGNDIVIFAILGLWYGERYASNDLRSGKIDDCFGNTSCDYVKWYVDELGDMRCTGTHHDGTNRYLYRAWKDGVSESTKTMLRIKWSEKRATRKDITRYTQRIGDRVADVYGWKVRK